ncbi:hypothetical protein HZA87_04430 [Candidatus Uhrbacteria bacterium]|nr:hypothetical protein [Candidatus Uhrbacteria bacterium]
MPKLISIGELIDGSWELYRARFVELITISGWFILTAILYAIALAFYPAASKLQLSTGLSGGETFGVILFSITTFIVTPIVSFWIYTSLIRAIGMSLDGKKMDPTKAMQEGKAIFLPALLTSLMVLLMILLAIVIGFAPPVVLATIGSLIHVGALVSLANILLLLGIFLSLFLTIKWTVYYLLSPLLTILDGTKGKAALEASRTLIKGRFLAVLCRVAVPKLVFVIFGVFAMYLISYLVAIIVDASSSINIDIQLRIATMLQTIVPILIATLVNPLILISDVLLLRSLQGEN